MQIRMQRRIQAKEMRCYHKILCVSYKDHVTNPAGNGTTQRPPDHHKQTQTEVLWICLPFIRFGEKHLAGHSERGKKTRWTQEEVGRQHQGMDRPGVRQVPEGGREKEKWRKLVVVFSAPNDPHG